MQRLIAATLMLTMMTAAFAGCTGGDDDGVTQADVDTAREEGRLAGIAEATPEQMLELKKAEQAFEVQMKELDVDVYKLEVEDTQDARKNFSKDWTARIMGIATVGGFLGYIFLVTLQPPEQNSEALINLVLGYLGGLASAVISFYFGASNSNKD